VIAADRLVASQESMDQGIMMSETQQFELEARREAIADLLRVRTAAWWTTLALVATCGVAAAVVLTVMGR